MKKSIITFMLLLCVSLVWAGGPWPKEKGTGYYKLGQSWIMANQYYSPNGSRVDIITTSLYATSLYGEYGITDRLTGVLYFPVFVRNTINAVEFNQSGKTIPGDALNGIGDIDFSLKYGFFTDKPIVMSASLVLSIPTGKTGGGDTGILQTGDGEFSQMLRVDAGHSFYPKPFWASAYVGFNNRTQNFSDEWRYGGEFGYNVTDRFTAVLKLNVVQSLFNGDAQVVENSIFSNNMEYVSPSLELAYALNDNIGVAVNGNFAVAGKNVLAAPLWTVGLYMNL